MPKINIHTLPVEDNSFFDICYDLINIVTHNNINDIFCYNESNYPMIDYYTLRLGIDNYAQEIKNYLNNNSNNKIILLAIDEGNITVLDLLDYLKLTNYYTETNQIIVISSGEFESGIHLNIDHFITITNSPYNQIIALNESDKIYDKIEKPYNFLCLNKIQRDHRTKLLNKLNNLKLLNRALWSCHWENNLLPKEYPDKFNNQQLEIKINNTSHEAHQAQWPDGLLFPQLYIDTYFSVVTETNFSIPVDYRTEKIYKPILIGHPFVAVSGYHFYQGLKNLGFKTFSGLIDETFDNILNDDDRINAISNTIKNLCASDLNEFIKAAKPICDYNRLHYIELTGKYQLTQYNSLIKFFNNL